MRNIRLLYIVSGLSGVLALASIILGARDTFVYILIAIILALIARSEDQKRRREIEAFNRAEAEKEQHRLEEARRAEEEAKRAEEEARNPKPIIKSWCFKIAGVTFRNDDGTSRQDILKRMYAIQEAGVLDEIDIQDYDYNGELAYGVYYNDEQFGNIKRQDIAEMDEAMNSDGITSCAIEIYHFRNEDGKKIYCANLTLYWRVARIPEQQPSD